MVGTAARPGLGPRPPFGLGLGSVGRGRPGGHVKAPAPGWSGELRGLQAICQISSVGLGGSLGSTAARFPRQLPRGLLAPQSGEPRALCVPPPRPLPTKAGECSGLGEHADGGLGMCHPERAQELRGGFSTGLCPNSLVSRERCALHTWGLESGPNLYSTSFFSHVNFLLTVMHFSSKSSSSLQ